MRAILVGFGRLGDVQGGEVHMRARVQGAGRGHYQAQAPAELLFAPVSVSEAMLSYECVQSLYGTH